MLYVVYAVLGLFVVAAASGAILLWMLVEDWNRDLTTNVAATDSQAADERLHPIRSNLQPAELAKRTASAAGGLPRWKLAGRNEDEGALELRYVRTTAVMRYKDDIRIRIEAADGGSLLTAESRSRTGRGDLGQNPRNLRELLAAVREHL